MNFSVGSEAKRAAAIYAWYRFAFNNPHEFHTVMRHFPCKHWRIGLTGMLDFYTRKETYHTLVPTGSPDIMSLFKEKFLIDIPKSVRLYFSAESEYPRDPTHWMLLKQDHRGFWLPEESGTIHEARRNGPAGYFLRPQADQKWFNPQRLAMGELGYDLDFVEWNVAGRKVVKRAPKTISTRVIEQYLWFRPDAQHVTVAAGITQDMYDYTAAVQRYTLTGERLGRSYQRTYFSAEPEYKQGMPTFALSHHEWGTQMSLWIAPNLFTRLHADLPEHVHDKLIPLAREHSTGTFIYKGWPLMLGVAGQFFAPPHDKVPVITFDPFNVFTPDSQHHRNFDFYVRNYALHLDPDGNLISVGSGLPHVAR